MGNDLVNTARAAARRGHRLPALEPHHPGPSLRTASALAAFASIVSQLEAGQASADAEPASLAWRPAPGARTGGPSHRPVSAAAPARRHRAGGLCGHRPGVRVGTSSPRSTPEPVPKAPHLSPDEVLRFAEDLVSFIEGLGSTVRGTGLHLRSTVAAGALAFLADELVSYARQESAESALHRMRAACLRSASAVQGLVGRAIESSCPSLAEALRELTAAGALLALPSPRHRRWPPRDWFEHPALFQRAPLLPPGSADRGARGELFRGDAGCRAPRLTAGRAAASSGPPERCRASALPGCERDPVRRARPEAPAARHPVHPSGGGKAGALRWLHGPSPSRARLLHRHLRRAARGGGSALRRAGSLPGVASIARVESGRERGARPLQRADAALPRGGDGEVHRVPPDPLLPKAGPVVRALARRELAASLGSRAEAERWP